MDKRAIARIVVGTGPGTGFLVAPQGLVLTALHVVADLEASRRNERLKQHAEPIDLQFGDPHDGNTWAPAGPARLVPGLYSLQDDWAVLAFDDPVPAGVLPLRLAELATAGEPDGGDAAVTDDATLDPAGGDSGARPRLRVEHGTRVLAVTDLGAGSIWLPPPPGRILAWRGFAQALHAHGASLIVLTPVPVARRPRELGALACVHWDRRTRPSQVHALARQLG